jgi:hypothetical protein
MQSMSMSRTNPNRMVRPMPRTAPRANPVPDPQSGPPPEGGPDVVAGTTIQRDPRDGELWVRAAMFSALEATRNRGCEPWRQADASNVRHDTIVVPERMSPAQVRALAERKAQAQVGEDDMVAFLYLHGSRPVGTEVEWRYSYQVIPRGDAATDTAG